jgi:molecular chaperone GrpE
MSDELRHDAKREGDAGPAPFSVVDRRPAFRDDAEPPAGPRHPTYVEELRARAEEAERRAREISAAYRRLEDEREAFRERLARDLERRVDIARADLMRNVIGVLDDLDRAIDAARGARAPAALVEGVALVRDRLLKALASEGVEPVDTLGRPFDPAVAEAVATEEVDDPSRDNLVVEEIGKGYTIGGTLLRAARVRVARRRPSDGPSESPPG